MTPHFRLPGSLKISMVVWCITGGFAASCGAGKSSRLGPPDQQGSGNGNPGSATVPTGEAPGSQGNTPLVPPLVAPPSQALRIPAELHGVWKLEELRCEKALDDDGLKSLLQQANVRLKNGDSTSLVTLRETDASEEQTQRLEGKTCVFQASVKIHPLEGQRFVYAPLQVTKQKDVLTCKDFLGPQEQVYSFAVSGGGQSLRLLESNACGAGNGMVAQYAKVSALQP